MDSGFGAEDGYGVYSKPMFNRGEAQSLYKPKTDDGDAWGDADQQMSQLTGTERFRADRGFKVSISHLGFRCFRRAEGAIASWLFCPVFPPFSLPHPRPPPASTTEG